MKNAKNIILLSNNLYLNGKLEYQNIKDQNIEFLIEKWTFTIVFKCVSVDFGLRIQ